MTIKRHENNVKRLGMTSKSAKTKNNQRQNKANTKKVIRETQELYRETHNDKRSHKMTKTNQIMT